MFRRSKTPISPATAALWLLMAPLLQVGCGPAKPPEDLEAGRLSPVATMTGGSDEGFALALGPRPFDFPRDHGPHPEFRSEWWYFVGHLETPPGATGEPRRFGYQLTFFRQALVPEAPVRASSWASRDLYMGHFALSDIDGERFFSAERFARGAVGLAGAEVPAAGNPWRVWIEDWQGLSTGDTALFPLQLVATDGDQKLDITLRDEKPPVFQGEDGYSRKGPEEGAASMYYSYTRLAAAGEVTIGGERFEVEGSGWLDREWSTSGLDPDQVGWDWLALQLSDGHDLMVYQIRKSDGSVEPSSHGSLVAADGSYRILELEDFELEPLATWTSPDGPTYPSGWRLRVPSAELDLTVEPLLADQELDLTFRYWEGAVGVTGRSGGAEVNGRGYVELVGYGEEPGRASLGR